MIAGRSKLVAPQLVLLCTACLLVLFAPSEARAQREFVQNIYLSGFKCVNLPRDTAVGGRSEIFFVIVSNAPESSGVQSRSVGTFNGVQQGFGRRTRNLVWSGRPQPLSLRVAMFEADAGGETGATAARALSSMVTSALGRAGGSGSRPIPRSASLEQDDAAEPQIVRQMGRGITNLLGLGHDAFGYDRQTFQRGPWADRSAFSEREIRYHFYTTHRQGGANCRAYFLIERGNEVPRESTPQPAPQYQDQSAQDYAPPSDIPPPYEEDYLPPPAPLPPLPPPPPPPPPPEPDWFRVSFRNSCDVPISLSYTYENPSRGWVKRGWGLLDPGETRRMEGQTLTPEIYIYTSKGRVAGSFDPEVLQFYVRNRGFDTDRDDSFRGDEGARFVPYSLHVLSDIDGVELVAIRDCDEWVAGRLRSAEEIARSEQVANFNARQARALINSSLDDAAFAGNVEGIRAALAGGADIENRSNRLSTGRSTPLHLAAQSFSADAINLLLDEGADPTHLNREGGSVLHAAVQTSDRSRYFGDFPAAAFERLIESGADPNHRDNDGYTPLDLMVRFADFATVRNRATRGENHGAQPTDLFWLLALHTTDGLDRKVRGYTALHIAALTGHRGLAEALIANGADLGVKDAGGRTARQLAASWPLNFQQLFGPLPEPAAAVARDETINPSGPEIRLPPSASDPERDYARCLELAARGMVAAEQCQPPSSTPPD